MTEGIENAVCLTFDVEWAEDEVVTDVVRALDERSLAGTFFCTHPGLAMAGHERALHPNFRRDGDTMVRLRHDLGDRFDGLSDREVFARVIDETHGFCPEAKGVRSHSLFFELGLLAVLRQAGLVYDSSYLLPLQAGIKPFATMWDIIELPIYYMDHLDLVNGITSFAVGDLILDRPGLKIIDFHPNLIFLNAASDDHYQASKPDYHNVDALRARRFEGRGVRSLFHDLLDHLVARGIPSLTLHAAATAWRVGDASE